jgi:hypothetical protein
MLKCLSWMPNAVAATVYLDLWDHEHQFLPMFHYFVRVECKFQAHINDHHNGAHTYLLFLVFFLPNSIRPLRCRK